MDPEYEVIVIWKNGYEQIFGPVIEVQWDPDVGVYTLRRRNGELMEVKKDDTRDIRVSPVRARPGRPAPQSDRR